MSEEKKRYWYRAPYETEARWHDEPKDPGTDGVGPDAPLGERLVQAASEARQMARIRFEDITVTLEGPQGCGKTTLARMLLEQFPHLRIRETNAPGSGMYEWLGNDGD